MRLYKESWVEFAAALWAFIFAVFHVIWATGWYVGLDAEQSRAAFAKPLFYAYDLMIAAMCVIAVPVALASVQPWGQRLPRKLLALLMWVGTSLLLLRAAASIAQTAYLLVAGQFSEEPRGIEWELWFYLGALLWGFTLWRFKTKKLNNT